MQSGLFNDNIDNIIHKFVHCTIMKHTKVKNTQITENKYFSPALRKKREKYFNNLIKEWQ